jgi:hypothetical protein
MSLRPKILYIYLYTALKFVNEVIYMDFRKATDELCARIDHDDIAGALGVSIQTVRQARMAPDVPAHRSPPDQWEKVLIRLAEERLSHYRKLIDRLNVARVAENAE